MPVVISHEKCCFLANLGFAQSQYHDMKCIEMPSVLSVPQSECLPIEMYSATTLRNTHLSYSIASKPYWATHRMHQPLNHLFSPPLAQSVSPCKKKTGTCNRLEILDKIMPLWQCTGLGSGMARLHVEAFQCVASVHFRRMFDCYAARCSEVSAKQLSKCFNGDTSRPQRVEKLRLKMGSCTSILILCQCEFAKVNFDVHLDMSDNAKPVAVICT